ncbi:CUGBP Elav-like family member 2 isoform X1 [Drosophila novamexicana]|uniref:CUGBP Elav-like family member 2 isoform X1 n=1 Tax=Drosophila novamexicana TaxID=47314 RepID=UPI0011E6042E|nr:CUGBP Elav-like family member 2 isoform X1 [Drosophila novamexicana]
MLSSLDALAGKIAKATPGTGAVAASANGNKPTNNAHHPAHQHHGTRHQLDYDYSAVEIEPPAEQLANSPRSERERLQQAQHAYEQQAQAELEFGLAEVDTKSCLTLLTHRRSSQSMHLLNHSAQAAAAAAAAAAGKSAGNGHARHQQQQQQHYHHPYQRPLRPVSPALQQQHSPPQHQQQQQQQQQSPYQQQLSHLAALQDHHQELLQSQQELFHKQLINLQQQQERERQSAVNYNDSCNSDHDSQHEYKICLRDSAFGMSDKSSSATNSLPNSPIHSNNNSSLLNNNNNSSLVGSNNSLTGTPFGNGNNNNANNSIMSSSLMNNNNSCSANRNVVSMDDDSCYRLDPDTAVVTYGEKEPDPDNIKMFVGQVPKSMDEAQLREMFEEYGPVHSINVLRDKATGISKGCCFVTFYTRRAALKAQDALHNVKTLNGMYHPIQMKPADSENRNERKLFVGMLNKKLNENDVRKLFEVHGAIEECTVLRDQNGQSKGCAFVTFATKHAAISAIKVTLSQNKIMEGCTSPLVVKFADTQKEKEQKKIQQIQANLWNLATNINIPLGQTPTTVSTPILPNPPQQPSPVMGADALTPASIQLLQQLQTVGLQQQLLQALTGLGAAQQNNSSQDTTSAAAGLLNPLAVQNLAAIAAMTQPSLTNAATSPGSAQLTNTAALLWSDPNPLASAYMSTAAGLPQFGSTTALSTSPLASVALSAAAAAAAGKQIEGPEGCNLFIYHLPQEFTDTDLASTFLPFGNVISAKVFIDKQTSLSKCFGFVSFDNPESAQMAIKAMNGFQVGTKRLKVQLKKPKDASKPY